MDARDIAHGRIPSCRIGGSPPFLRPHFSKKASRLEHRKLRRFVVSFGLLLLVLVMLSLLLPLQLFLLAVAALLLLFLVAVAADVVMAVIVVLSLV